MLVLTTPRVLLLMTVVLQILPKCTSTAADKDATSLKYEQLFRGKVNATFHHNTNTCNETQSRRLKIDFTSEIIEHGKPYKKISVFYVTT